MIEVFWIGFLKPCSGVNAPFFCVRVSRATYAFSSVANRLASGLVLRALVAVSS